MLKGPALKGSDCFLVCSLKAPFAPSGQISDGVIACTFIETRVPAALVFEAISVIK